MRKTALITGIAAAAMTLGLFKPALAAPITITAPIHRIGSSGTGIMVPGQPDLVIRGARISPAKICRPGLPALHVAVAVKNIGGAASAAKWGVGMVQAIDTGSVHWGNGHGLRALAPGQSALVRFPIYYLQSNPAYMQGTHSFRLRVNVGKWIKESNYANNHYGPVTVTLPAGFCQKVSTPSVQRVPAMVMKPLPDLVIRAARISPTDTCRPGFPVLNVAAEVKNIGSGPSAAKAGVGMVQALDSGGTSWGNGHGLQALAPGQSTLVTFPIYYLQSNPAYMQGTHSFRVRVNIGKWIEESNYGNNDFGLVQVTVPAELCH